MTDFKIFDRLGGEEAAMAVLKARAGKSPTPDVVRKWRSFLAMPAWAALAFSIECQSRGILFNPDDCRMPGWEKVVRPKPRKKARKGKAA